MRAKPRKRLTQAKKRASRERRKEAVETVADAQERSAEDRERWWRLTLVVAAAESLSQTLNPQDEVFPTLKAVTAERPQ
jgi:hypothetical protein